MNTKKKKNVRFFLQILFLWIGNILKLHLFYTRVLDKNNVITIFHVIGITLTKKKKYLHENGALKSISFTFTPVSYASLK